MQATNKKGNAGDRIDIEEQSARIELARRERRPSLLTRLSSSQGSMLILDQAAISISSFLSMVLVGRFGGETELGTYSLAFVTLWFSASIPNSLVWVQFAIRSARLKGMAALRHERAAAWHVIVFSALMAVPVLAVVWTVPNRSVAMFTAMISYISGMLIREHFRRVLMSKKDMRTLLWSDMLSSTLQVLALLWLAGLGHLGATTGLFVNGLFAVVPSLFLMAKLNIIKVSVRKVWIDFLRNWGTGTWLAGASLVGAACDSIIRYSVFAMMGASELGRFSAAFSLPYVVNPLVLTLTNWQRVSMAHKAASDAKGNLGAYTMSLVGYVALAGVVVFGMIALIGEQAGYLLYGFTGLGATIVSICIGLAVWTVVSSVEVALSTLGQVRAILYSNLLRMICMLLTVGPLIHWFGLVGAGISVSIGYVAAFAIQFSQLMRVYLSEKPVTRNSQEFT